MNEETETRNSTNNNLERCAEESGENELTVWP
jgi:hypothetical protein